MNARNEKQSRRLQNILLNQVLSWAIVVVFLVISLFVFVFVFAKTPQLVVEWVNWSHFSPMAVNAIERKTACTSKTGERQMLSMPRWITRFANAETHN